MPGTPFPVGGTIYDTDTTTALGEATVIIQNLRTLDKASTTSDEVDGSYAFELSDDDDFPEGYEAGDEVIFYARKVISVMAEKYAVGTAKIAGDSLDKNLTVVLYINKEIYPLPRLDKRDSEMRMFDPHSRAMRIVPVSPDGTKYQLFAQKDGDDWKLVLPDGTQFGAVSIDGAEADFSITGDFRAGETF